MAVTAKNRAQLTLRATTKLSKKSVLELASGLLVLRGFLNPGMKAGADFLRRVGAPPSLGPGDRHARRGDARESGQAYDLPPAHGPRLPGWPFPLTRQSS
jgi:hypothetical protein